MREILNYFLKGACVRALIVLLSFGFGSLAFGADRLMIKGYDPVSYFQAGAPVKGSPQWKSSVGGEEYLFSSEANQKLFLSSPDKYKPQYEGWCAYGVAQGKKIDIDPHSYQVKDGKLFLFYTDFLTDTRKKWLKDEKNLSEKAAKNWSQVRTQKEE